MKIYMMEEGVSSMVSDYERQRIANIQRNNQYLEELGINARISAARSDGGKKSKKRKMVEEVELVQPTRRSSRVASLAPISYKEDTINDNNNKSRKLNEDSLSEEKEPPELAVGSFTGIDNNFIESIDETLRDGEVTSNDGQSVSSLNAHLTPFFNEFLCKPLEEYGKLPIMIMSNNGKAPKFNKYPGVLEWKNCLYLWVNVGGKTGYTNTFSEGGRYMMWYGGSKMKSDSRVTLRLIHPNNKASEGTEEKIESEKDNSHRVVLFVRLESEGYCCLGEVKYSALDLDKHPIQIKWELLSFPQISSNEYFQTILKEAHYS